MYSWNHGIETHDLYGKPISYVYPELCERIKEALLQDNRIKFVDDFSYDIPDKGKLLVKFTEHTIYGNFDSEKEVNI